MAQEYYEIKYDDREGVEIEIRIIDVSEDPEPAVITPAYGRAIIEFDQVDDPFTILRPSICTIELEADTSNTYSDLFTDNEREHKVELYRAGTLAWEGWLSPEGIFEDYVNDAWVITLTAQDGISDLENKAYVDSLGALYEGQESLKNIVLNCLERTGLLTGCYFMENDSTDTDYPVRYVDATTGRVSYFDQVVDQRAFLDDDGKTPKSCAEVLKDILLGANGYLHAWGGYFYVNWIYQHGRSSVDGDYDWTLWEPGEVTAGTSENRDVNVTIGSQINGFSTHWINANQRIERRPTLGASKINYKFRQAGSVLANPELDNNGSTITGWTESLDAASSDVVVLNTDGTVTLQNGSQTSAVLTSDASASDVEAGTVIRIIFNFNVDDSAGGFAGTQLTKFKFRVFLDSSTNYYLTEDLTWSTSADDALVRVSNSGDFEVQFETDIIPETGTVTLSVYPIDDNSGSTFYSDEITLDYISITNLDANPPEGISYEAYRFSVETSYTAPTLEVTLGDFNSVAYLGTYFKSDGTSKTNEGYVSPTIALGATLYGLVLIDRMQMRGKTLRVFTGDVYGFFRYDSRIAIDGISGVYWLPTGWTWDTKENIISASMWEIFYDATPGDLGDTTTFDDIVVEKIINYGNVIEPTIKS